MQKKEASQFVYKPIENGGFIHNSFKKCSKIKGDD